MRAREISLIDLIFYILLRWRSIVAAMLIGAIVLGGFGFIRSRQSYEDQVQQVEGTKNELVKLEDKQLWNVQSVLLYEQIYEDTKARVEENVRMQANSDQIYKTELTFRVNAATIEDATNIERVYEDAVVSGELQERLAAVLQSSTVAVSDVFDLSRGTGNLAEGGDSFCISISHYDEAICAELIQTVKDFVSEKAKLFQKNMGQHGIAVVNVSAAKMIDAEIWNYQSEYYKDLLDQKNNIEKLINAFSQQEQQYYNFLINENNDNSSDDMIVPSITTSPGISLKYIILGMVLGAFVLVFWFFMLYILNGKLRAGDNLQEIYGISQLGNVSGGKEEKKWFDFVDKWIIALRDYNKRKFTPEEALELAAIAVKMAAGKENLDVVYVAGCDLKGEVLKVCSALQTRLAKENIRVEILNNILYDAQAMRDLEHAKGVVLVETANATLYSEIAQELELLKRQEICVLGGIIA